MTFTLPGGLRQDKRRCYSHSASITPQAASEQRVRCAPPRPRSGELGRAVTELERVVELDRQVGHPDLQSNTEMLHRMRQELASSTPGALAACLSRSAARSGWAFVEMV